MMTHRIGGIYSVVEVSHDIELVTAPKCQKQLLLSSFLREVLVYDVNLL
jgi:hypothetical protein